LDIVIRTVVAFFVIVLITRIVGRRELSSMEPFDLILLVVLGDLVQQGVTQNDESMTGAILVLFTLTVLTTGLAYANFRFSSLRPALEGHPVVLVENGKLIERNANRERLTVEEIESEARLQQIESLEQVRLGILETSGRISFIKSQS
jgi:uncharacterized membrane protein YcaP (DUF421 family)